MIRKIKENKLICGFTLFKWQTFSSLGMYQVFLSPKAQVQVKSLVFSPRRVSVFWYCLKSSVIVCDSSQTRVQVMWFVCIIVPNTTSALVGEPFQKGLGKTAFWCLNRYFAPSQKIQILVRWYKNHKICVVINPLCSIQNLNNAINRKIIISLMMKGSCSALTSSYHSGSGLLSAVTLLWIQYVLWLYHVVTCITKCWRIHPVRLWISWKPHCVMN